MQKPQAKIHIKQIGIVNEKGGKGVQKEIWINGQTGKWSLCINNNDDVFQAEKND